MTGTPRSGSTFVGRILSAHPTTDYIHEPFNPACGIPSIDTPFVYLRPNLNKSEESSITKTAIQSIFTYDFTLKTAIYPTDSLKKRVFKKIVGSRGSLHLRVAKLNPFHKSTIIKDPIGCLLSKYLEVNHNVRVLVMFRHPIAFVASMVRLNWEVKNLCFLASQQHLVEDYFAGDTTFLTKEWPNNIEGAAALWTALNRVLLKQASYSPNWVTVKHEDLCTDPLGTFRDIHESLGLPWNALVQANIMKKTSNANQTEAKRGVAMDINRNSSQLFEHRLQQLTTSEKRSIFAITEEVAMELYSEESFNI